MIESLQALVNFMMAQAQSGDKNIELNIQNKHLLHYLADIEYIEEHLINIKKGLIDY